MLARVFAASDVLYRQLRARAAGVTHAELEDQIAGQGRELLRSLFQDSLDLGAMREELLPEAPVDADGVVWSQLEKGRRRALSTEPGALQSQPPSPRWSPWLRRSRCGGKGSLRSCSPATATPPPRGVNRLVKLVCRVAFGLANVANQQRRSCYVAY
ncbi:hypothetical protein [Frankia sp. Cj3]|uniref:hypothetical protein n=1 Tax=Frankia sp. Cj3 TaxID=2880976 RepID=UPI001EF3EE58|nr:hypothetical protein [Frankia sp. Cj3]